MDRGIMEEAKRLYGFGFGVHWIQRNSKVPVEKGWADGKRQSIEELERTRKKGYGLGVRLGRASKLNGNLGYLVNIDVDIKSKSSEAVKEAHAALHKLFPGITKQAPTVKTGNGFRFLCRTETPAPSQKLLQSSEKCKVRLNEKKIPPSQKAYIKAGLITAKELEAGWRIRPAWEIDFLSDKKQGVFPPSIHPETGKLYAWTRDIEDLASIPLIDPPVKEEHLSDQPLEGEISSDDFLRNWKPVKIDLETTSLPEKWIRMIRDGEELLLNKDGNDDPSASSLAAAIVMLNAGFSHDEILSILTDRENFLGETPYSEKHRNTGSRRVAADWVYKYCILKAARTVSPENVFKDVPVEETLLDEEKAEKQEKQLTGHIPEKHWTDRLERGKRSKPEGTLKNTSLALLSLFGREAFAHDEFAYRDYFARDLPWAEAGETIRDIHVTLIKAFLAEKYAFVEPASNTVNEALSRLCHQNMKNPAKDFFLSLPPWDGIDRIHGWLQKNFHAEGPDAYIDEVFRKWMVAAVARVFEPGLKFDWIPIFEGEQGRGKSLFGRILFGEDFFSDQLPPLDHAMADAVLQIQGRLCIELAELAALNRSTLEGIKAFITRQIDVVRVPYGRRSESFPRRCVFYGTTNRSNYLTDETGNRRFNPIRVGQLNIKALKKDRLALWSEAVFIYRNGLEDHFYLGEEARLFAEEIQREKKVFSEVDHLEEIIREFIFSGNQFPWHQFRISDLFLIHGPLGNAGMRDDAKNSKNARLAIKNLGGKSIRNMTARFWSLDASIFGARSSNSDTPMVTLLN